MSLNNPRPIRVFEGACHVSNFCGFMQAHAMAFGGHFRGQFDLGLHQCCEWGLNIASSDLLPFEEKKTFSK